MKEKKTRVTRSKRQKLEWNHAFPFPFYSLSTIYAKYACVNSHGAMGKGFRIAS